MKFALVIDDVIDTIFAQSGTGLVSVPDDVFAGFLRDGEDWSAPVGPSAAEILNTERESWTLTDIQFSLAAEDRGWMTMQEAENWVGDGSLPQMALDAIALLPFEAQGAARVRFRGARFVERLDPFLPFLQAAASPQITDTELDDAFRAGLLL